jgi:gamma-glutamyl-gamma-aminobutyrate hydrolase PuuD
MRYMNLIFISAFFVTSNLNALDDIKSEALDLSEIREFTEEEYFDKKLEDIKYFIGQYKDFPDPEFDTNLPLRVPNQEDIENLFKYMRKYIDSLEEGGPNPEAIKQHIFMDENNKIDLNKLLNKFRFKAVFNDLSFSVPSLTYNHAKGVPGVKPIRYTSLFHNIKLDNAEFNNVKLENTDFSGSELNNIKIIDSTFSRALCMRCSLDNINIINSDAKEADFSFSSGTINFENSNLSYLKITDSDFDKLSFNGGTLTNSSFINSGDVDLNDTKVFSNIFDSSTPNSLSLKTVGIVYKNGFPGGTANKVLNILRNQEIQPIKIEYGLEKFVDEEALQNEVVTIIDEVRLLNDKNSISKRFIKKYEENPQNYPNIDKIAKMSQGYINKVQGLIIPGGLDIEPYFFNSELSASSFYDDQRARLKGKKNIEAEEFPIRSTLEIFLIYYAQQKNLPLLLLCRGAHIYNIIKNGMMIENLPDVYDDVNFEAHLRYVDEASNLTTADKEQKLYKLFAKQKKPVAVYGNHHQAIDEQTLNSDLKTLLIWKLRRGDYIPYALYDKSYEAGAWLFQFHPEVKEEMGGAMARQLSVMNNQIFDAFFQLMDKPKNSPRPVKEPLLGEEKPLLRERTVSQEM